MANFNLNPKKIYKWFLYFGLAGVKAFMSSFMIIIAFFVERFFIAKYVDYNLAEGIVPIINQIGAMWTWIFWALFAFYFIINYRELKNSEKKEDGK